MQPLRPGAQSILVVTPSVPATRKDDSLYLDDKAISGLTLYRRYWPGKVRCIFREGPSKAILFGTWHKKELLPFEIVIIPEGSSIPDALLKDASVVMGSGDNYLDLSLAKQCHALEVPIVFVIEYTIETRLQIIALADNSVIKRIKSILWAIKTELKRRRAFAQADALQANGIPASESYARTNKRLLTFFDGRLSESMIASDQDLARKFERHQLGRPLQLSYSGRLERMKGADHLVPLAEKLVSRGVDFQFHIYGVGSMSSQLREEVRQKKLDERVFIHDPLPFETELVPWMRQNANLFICCHPQSDPSCTYIETLGCGVPIVGYRNRAIEGIMRKADVGKLVEVGNLKELVDVIATLAAQPQIINEKARNAIALAHEHNFEATFAARVAHLKTIARCRVNK